MTKTRPIWLDDKHVTSFIGIPVDDVEEEFEEDDDDDKDVPPKGYVDSDPLYAVVDRGLETEIAYAIIESLNEAGYTPAAALAGLMHAAILLADQTPRPGKALDECCDLLYEEPTDAK